MSSYTGITSWSRFIQVDNFGPSYKGHSHRKSSFLSSRQSFAQSISFKLQIDVIQQLINFFFNLLNVSSSFNSGVKFKVFVNS